MWFRKNAVDVVKIGWLALVLAVVGCSSNTEKRSNEAGNPAPSATQAMPAPATQPSSNQASFPASSSPAQSAAAPGAGVIQSQDTNSSGVVGELTEAKRSDGVLTIKVRFRNTGNQRSTVSFTSWNAPGDNEKFYVTAGEKKYFMLKDSDGTYLSTNSSENGLVIQLNPGQTFMWWAKYPAPGVEAKKFNFVTPVAPPFEDVPITDK